MIRLMLGHIQQRFFSIAMITMILPQNLAIPTQVGMYPSHCNSLCLILAFLYNVLYRYRNYLGDRIIPNGTIL